MSINLGHIVATVDGDHLTGEPVAARAAAALILTPAQAEAVYSAMCALNNVSGRVAIKLPGGVGGYEKANGTVVVFNSDRGANPLTESYPDQNAFATAYGLSTGA